MCRKERGSGGRSEPVPCGRIWGKDSSSGYHCSIARARKLTHVCFPRGPVGRRPLVVAGCACSYNGWRTQPGIGLSCVRAAGADAGKGRAYAPLSNQTHETALMRACELCYWAGVKPIVVWRRRIEA